MTSRDKAHPPTSPAARGGPSAELTADGLGAEVLHSGTGHVLDGEEHILLPPVCLCLLAATGTWLLTIQAMGLRPVPLGSLGHRIEGGHVLSP